MKWNVANIVVVALVTTLCVGMTGCKRADNSGGTQGSSSGMSAPAASSGAMGAASGASQ
jgi:hypothetical protein